MARQSRHRVIWCCVFSVVLVSGLVAALGLWQSQLAYDSQGKRQRMLQALGTAFKAYAYESKGEVFPPMSPVPGEFLPDLDALKPYLDEAGNAGDIVSYVRGDTGFTLCYTQHLLLTDGAGAAFLDAYREKGNAGVRDKDVALEYGVLLESHAYPMLKIPRLREGAERYVICEISNPAASPYYQSIIPVLWEMPGRGDWLGRKRCCVLYMDGHVECLPYPGPFPLSEGFTQELAEIMRQRGTESRDREARPRPKTPEATKVYEYTWIAARGPCWESRYQGPWWEIARCAEEPDVDLDGTKGYRVVLRPPEVSSSGEDGANSYVELLLFPGNPPLAPDSVSRASWTVEFGQDAREVDLGEAHGFRWLGRMSEPDEATIRGKLALFESGDGPRRASESPSSEPPPVSTESTPHFLCTASGFSQVMQERLSGYGRALGLGDRAALDLDAGLQSGVPYRILMSDDPCIVYSWLRDQGADIYVDSYSWMGFNGLSAINMVMLPVSEQAWSYSAEEVVRRLSRASDVHAIPNPSDYDGRTHYLFRTQGGTVGVISVETLVTKGPPSSGVCYKLVDPDVVRRVEAEQARKTHDQTRPAQGSLAPVQHEAVDSGSYESHYRWTRATLDGKTFIDLDSGSLFQLPDFPFTPDRANEVADLVKAAGVDLMVCGEDSPHSLVGFGTTVVAIGEGHPDALYFLSTCAPSLSVQPICRYHTPNSMLFRTREGGTGYLTVERLNPQDPLPIEISYELIDPEELPLATQRATDLSYSRRMMSLARKAVLDYADDHDLDWPVSLEQVMREGYLDVPDRAAYLNRFDYIMPRISGKPPANGLWWGCHGPEGVAAMIVVRDRFAPK